MTTDHRRADDALAQWLRLREEADAAARSVRLRHQIVEVLARRRREAVHILDLGTGGGSNLRYLIPHLPVHQRWLVVDRRATLLSDLLARTSPWAGARGYSTRSENGRMEIRGAALDCDVDTHEMDLGPLSDVSIFGGRDLVTASALLDLVSESWLRKVAAQCRRVGAAALFAITYDGRSLCSPAAPEDAMVLDLFNRHQRTDKGLGGLAAGPEAAALAIDAFSEQGYTVESERSDWEIGPDAPEMQRYLIDGWASAAMEVEPEHASVIERWRATRLAHVDAGESHVTVGHYDVAALP